MSGVLPVQVLPATESLPGCVVRLLIPPGNGIVKALRGDLREVVVDLSDIREPAHLDRGDRGRRQPSERLPDNVSLVSGGVEDAAHEVQWLLVQVRGRQ